MLRKVGLTPKIIALAAVTITLAIGALWAIVSRETWIQLEAKQRAESEQYVRTLSLVFAGRIPGSKIQTEGPRVTRITAPALDRFSDLSIVDESVSYTGGNATIFAYDKSADKFVRRATTVKKENGERAIGTALADDSPAQAVLRRGEPYYGPATLFGSRFYTIYQPTFDEAGRVNGIFYVGIPVETYFAAHAEIMTTITLAAVVIALLACAMVGIAAGRLFKPLRSIAGRMAALAQGDLDSPIAYQDRGDEIGMVARALGTFHLAMVKNQDLTAEQMALGQRNEAERRSMTLDLAQRLEAEVGLAAEGLSLAAAEVQESAGVVAGAVDRTRSRATEVAATSEETSNNVQTVAAATEELTASLGEVSTQVTRAAQVARRAAGDAEHTDSAIRDLATVTQRIGDVVSLISTVAGQTNLLALNATIEAARAGDAGRGFAVVAQEVKVLATQTAQATDDIRTQIDTIQKLMQQAVQAVAGIGVTVREMDDIATTISATVQQQQSATQEIANSVMQAARGTQEVSHNIVTVGRDADQGAQAAQDALITARSMAARSEELRSALGRFLAQVRAA